MSGRWVLVGVLALVVALIVWLGQGSPREATDAPSLSARSPRESGERPVELALAPPMSEAREVLVPSEAPTAPDAEEPTSPGPTSILLYGIVRPAPGRDELRSTAWIVLVDELAERVLGQAGEDGAYSIAGLRPGRYWVQAGSEDGERRAMVDLDGTQERVRLDLELVPRSELLVKVVDGAGEPAPHELGLLAVATLEPPGDWLEEVSGSFNNPFGVGRFQYTVTNHLDLPPEYLGRLTLDVAPPVFVSLVRYQRVVMTQRVESGATEVEFVIDPRSPLLAKTSFRLRLVERSTRTPLAGARVSCFSHGVRFLGADEEGLVRLTGCSPGWYALRVQAKGYERGEFLRLVELGSENDFGDLELEPEQWVAGVVVDELGQGVACSVECELVDPATERIQRRTMRWLERTGADGSFRIGGLSRGTYRIELNRDGPWGEAAWQVDTRSGPALDLRLQVARGVPLVLHVSAVETRGISWEIFDAYGTSLITRRRVSPEPEKLLLAPARYEIEVRVEGQAPERRAFTIEREPVVLSIP